MRMYLPAALLIACAAPTAAQTRSATAQPAQAAAKVDPLDKVVCRREESLGSRLNVKKVCQTVREWKEQSEASREATERLQQGQGTVPSG